MPNPTTTPQPLGHPVAYNYGHVAMRKARVEALA